MAMDRPGKAANEGHLMAAGGDRTMYSGVLCDLTGQDREVVGSAGG